MVAKLTKLTQKNGDTTALIGRELYICNSRSRRSFRKLLDTPAYPDHLSLCDLIILKIFDEEYTL